MNFPFALLFGWLFGLWLLGWLSLPWSRRVFANLPDGGLAAGRALLLVLVTLLLFWGAALHVLPLGASAVFLWLGAFFVAGFLLKTPASRQEFFVWLRENRAVLLISDAIFLSAFLFFGWIRWRHPELNEFEKPMDAMLLSSLAHTRFLPMENPWLSGVPFTNYYYFGPLLGATLSRAFFTAPVLAYNLVQPFFCALFISILWSLGAALTRSWWRGVIVMSVVALLGHFEPLRQIQKNGALWPLDWWSTSRVIDFTINEYPLFTLSLGDAHAHFYALSLGALFFCLCFSLFATRRETVSASTLNVPSSNVPATKSKSRKAKQSPASTLKAQEIPPDVATSASVFRLRLLLLGLILGAVLLTNTWDVPLYTLLAIFCVSASQTLPAPRATKIATLARAFGWSLLAPLLALLAALPYLRLFHSPVSGIEREWWLPSLASCALLWGGFGVMWLLNLVGWRLVKHEEDAGNSLFLRAMIFCGGFALLAPLAFYINGKFGGDLRHQDTVFKFGLQAWLLLGIGLSGGVLRLLRALPRVPRWVVGVLLVVLSGVPLLCSATVVWSRAIRDASRDESGNPVLLLNGARFLPEDDQAAIEWLRRNAAPDAVLLEAVNPVKFSSYSQYGRVATFSGVPSLLGWSQHVWFWGADLDHQVYPRYEDALKIYQWRDKNAALALLRKWRIRYIFVGEEERKIYDPNALQRIWNDLPRAFEAGETFIAVVPR